MSSAAALPSAPAGFLARLSTMGRARQFLSTFAAVFAAYWLYWLIAVPLIEPNVEHEATAARTPEEKIQEARHSVGARQRDIAKYFPPDAWELQNPAIWESEHSRLLFKSLRPLRDGSVELRPCTMLFFPKNANALATSPTEPIIMRAVEGAIVRFDEPIVLKNVDLAKRQLVGGRLMGPITIYRSASRPGAADDLEITTHDVEMLKDRVWTPHPVQFRLGRSHGSGRDMEIRLVSAGGPSGPGIRGGTVRTLELKRDVTMQLELASGPLAAGAAVARRKRPDPPIDITCQGPFRFDVERNAASFRDYVNVFRPNVAGQSDQLNCELLTVYFESSSAEAPAAQSAAPAATDRQLGASQVRLIEARGDPVTLRSPSRGVYAHCTGVDYFPAPGEALGRLIAIGPGAMEGKLPSDTAGNYDAHWTREFRFEPVEGNQHRAAIIGGAQVRLVQMGTIKADEIFAWLTPTSAPAVDSPTRPPPAPTQPATAKAEIGAAVPADSADAVDSPAAGWQFERLLAREYQQRTARSQGNVVIVSPQLHGVTGQLEAFVDRPVVPNPNQASPQASEPSDSPPQTRGDPVRTSPQPPQNPAQRFDVSGGVIRMHLVPAGEQLAVSTVTVENQARLKEVTPPRDGETPIIVEGDRLHVTGASSEATHVTVNGRPGYLEAGGIKLRGAAIEMEKNTNRLWVDGPGRMTMPVEQDLNGQPLAQPQPLDITWQGGMVFQGNSVVYERNVLVQTEHQFLRTEKLEAIFNRPIDFSNAKAAAPANPEDKPQLSHVRCFGRAYLKGREFDERGQQTSMNELDAVDLAVNKATGDISGRGPGSLTRVARGSPRAAEAPGGAQAARPGGAAARPRAQNAGRPDDELTYLNVQFQSSIDGNLNRRTSRFGEPTKTVYGPVTDWTARLNPDDPARLGPHGLVLDARHLDVREMPARDRRDRGWFELQADGNVVAEGAQFTARGDHLTYAEEKDQMVLRGDGLSPAEFFQDNPADGSRRASRANELTYWFTLQQVRVTSFQSLDISVPNNSPPKPQKKSKFLP